MHTGLSVLRRRRRLIVVFLPALLLRALIPAGFMPVAASGGLSLGLCPGAADLPPGIARTHAHHHAGTAGAPQGAARHAPCLFAASSTVAGAPAMPALVLAASVPATADAGRHQRIFPPTILRAQSARAPPTPA